MKRCGLCLAITMAMVTITMVKPQTNPVFAYVISSIDKYFLRLPCNSREVTGLIFRSTQSASSNSELGWEKNDNFK